jgi:hypothetical protein
MVRQRAFGEQVQVPLTRENFAPGALTDPAGALISSEYYALTSQPSGFSLSATAMVANRSVHYPWRAPRSFQPQSLGVFVTLGQSGANVKIIIRRMNAQGWPGDVFYASGVIGAAISDTNLFSGSGSLMPTFVAGTHYWIGIISNSNPSLRSQTSVTNSILNHLALPSATTMSTSLHVTTDDYTTPTGLITPSAAVHSSLNTPIVIARI